MRGKLSGDAAFTAVFASAVALVAVSYAVVALFDDGHRHAFMAGGWAKASIGLALISVVLGVVAATLSIRRHSRRDRVRAVRRRPLTTTDLGLVGAGRIGFHADNRPAPPSAAKSGRHAAAPVRP